MSSYLKNVPIRTATPKELDEMQEEKAPKTRKPRGTSEFVQVKVRRSIFEPLAVVGKMNSLSTAQVIERILEVHVKQYEETLQSLRLDDSF